MIYLVGQIGLILAVTALLFFGLGYWYGRHKSVIQEQPMMFEEGSVTAAAVSVLEDRIKQKDLQISLIQEQMDDLEAGITRVRDHDDPDNSSHFTEDQGDTSAATGWLRENLQQHGGLRRPAETIEHAIGKAPSGEPLLDYLEAKFGDIYKLASVATALEEA